ncbi:hypothetical protein MTP16_25070 (plasmid) [Hymenobacter monticola]|uniref:Uncharacterized protein n=1 Tax=Hymenobacter monticola TaxID=1705399 RepID=A0ABY4BBV7_9BACT|nr:hypothetical protein [Hymenobacter monticola]UOE36652.1 hypothetical protein MTP16_25070 [Hymenobacter monticola]
MEFLQVFSYVSIFLFSYTLLYAWLSIAAGSPSHSSGKLRGQLVLLLTVVITFSVYGFTSKLTQPLYALLPILLVVILLSASRVGYEKDYDTKSFARSFMVKMGISLIVAFCAS